MDEEIASFKKNGTWKLVLKLNEKNPIDVKWIYKEKKNVKWEIKRYKTRLVAKDYSQKQEIDYDEIFALVARLEIIQLIIVITVLHRWKIFQMDIKSAFLNDFLEEEIYIEQLMGYEVSGHETRF